MPLRRDRRARIVTYLSIPLADELTRAAAEHGRTVSAQAAELLELALDATTIVQAQRLPAGSAGVPPRTVDDAERVRTDPEYADWLRRHGRRP